MTYGRRRQRSELVGGILTNDFGHDHLTHAADQRHKNVRNEPNHEIDHGVRDQTDDSKG